MVEIHTKLQQPKIKFQTTHIQRTNRGGCDGHGVHGGCVCCGGRGAHSVSKPGPESR